VEIWTADGVHVATATPVTGAERARLARILGMLGSDYAGERASAGLQAEAFRKRHGLTWEGMLSLPPVDAAPDPEPPESPPPPAHAPPAWGARTTTRWGSSNAPEQMKALAVVVAWISLPVLLCMYL
jgi:hypothetical protein